MSIDEYSIEEHQHRYSAWAASRAASVKNCRFSVAQGKQIIEASGLSSLQSPNDLPTVGSIDLEHREWRNLMISAAAERGFIFTHGIAAKLINVYLKTRFVCGGHHENPRVTQLHPPIDALLLRELAAGDAGGFKSGWNKAISVRWSKFNASEYEEVIDLIRRTLAGRPLWLIESYWRGFQ